MIEKGLLQRVQAPGFVCQAFDGGDALAADFVREERASADGKAIDQDRAAAADLGFAGNFYARQAAASAQNFGESFALLDLESCGLAIQLET